MKIRVLILLTGLLTGEAVAASSYTNLAGYWKGLWTVDANGSNRIFLKITNSSFVGGFDDLDTGENNIVITSVNTNPFPSVRFVFNSGYSYTGIVDSVYTQLTGTWSYSGQSWPVTFYRQPGVDDFLPLTNTTVAGSLLYRLWVPTNYTAAQSYPLILYLHGSGGRGNDNRSQLSGDTGPLALVFNENQASHPSFVAAPQCPSGGDWTNSTMHSELLSLISALESGFNIDTNRIYVTGLSLGGNGTWDLLTRNPTLFTAGVPMSGESYTASAEAFFSLPVWVFHALDDPTVSVTNSQIMVAGMKSLGGRPIYTEYAQGEHAIWSASYANRLLYDWLMDQTRGSFSNGPPFVAIVSPTTRAWFGTPGSSTALAGTAGNALAQISQVAWTNNRTGNGAASGTTNWSVSSVALQSSTNLVTVMAQGTAWVSNYLGHTTFSDSLWIDRAPMLSFSASNGLATLSWTGGSPPYSLDESTNLATGVWQPLFTNSITSTQFSLTRPAAYFRVRSQ